MGATLGVPPRGEEQLTEIRFTTEARRAAADGASRKASWRNVVAGFWCAAPSESGRVVSRKLGKVFENRAQPTRKRRRNQNRK